MQCFHSAVSKPVIIGEHRQVLHCQFEIVFFTHLFTFWQLTRPYLCIYCTVFVDVCISFVSYSVQRVVTERYIICVYYYYFCYFFWPSVDIFPREFKNWDIQNWVQIYQSVQSGVGKLSCNKTALKRIFQHCLCYCYRVRHSLYSASWSVILCIAHTKRAKGRLFFIILTITIPTVSDKLARQHTFQHTTHYMHIDTQHISSYQSCLVPVVVVTVTSAQ